VAGTLPYIGLGSAIAAQAIGVPLPAETALIAAAVLAAHGKLALGGVILAGAVGAIAGGIAGYAVGRIGGRAIAARPGLLPRRVAGAIGSGEAFFARHGGRAVLLARWASGVRMVAAPLAGMHGMGRWRFALWNGVGGILWPASVAIVAYLLGRRIAVLIGVFALGALGAAFVTWGRRKVGGADTPSRAPRG
jgi:membrane-associated protein